MDFSRFVSELHVKKTANYAAQTNAAGNTIVDYINSKRVIEVGIIPLDDESMVELLDEVNTFNVTLSFLNPNTGTLEDKVSCIIPDTNIEYYTIQAGKVLYKALKLKFIEL